MRIKEIHDESKGTYGYLRAHKTLVDEGTEVGKWRVRRLMRASGLEGRAKKRWRTTTVPDPEAEAAKDLIQRHFGPCDELDRRYVGDITYIATWEGWAYLATVIDLASRRVVGWALADHMRTELVEDALTMAFANRAPQRGVIFHSDRGCQYTSRDFAELARANGVVLSVGRKGDAGTTPSPRASLPPSSASSSTHARGRRGPDSDAPSSNTSKAGHAPAALGARLPQPRSIRSCQPQGRASGGIINTTNLSVEPDQAQPSAGYVNPRCRESAALRHRVRQLPNPTTGPRSLPSGRV